MSAPQGCFVVLWQHLLSVLHLVAVVVCVVAFLIVATWTIHFISGGLIFGRAQ